MGKIGGGPGIHIVDFNTDISGPSLRVGAQEIHVVEDRPARDLSSFVEGVLTLQR